MTKSENDKNSYNAFYITTLKRNLLTFSNLNDLSSRKFPRDKSSPFPREKLFRLSRLQIRTLFIRLFSDTLCRVVYKH